MDKQITILYKTGIGQHLASSSFQFKKSDKWNPDVTDQEVASNIMQNGVYSQSDDIVEYVPPQSIMNIIFIPIKEEE